jgi:hypothetical protein
MLAVRKNSMTRRRTLKVGNNRQTKRDINTGASFVLDRRDFLQVGGIA